MLYGKYLCFMWAKKPQQFDLCNAGEKARDRHWEWACCCMYTSKQYKNVYEIIIYYVANAKKLLEE